MKDKLLMYNFGSIYFDSFKKSIQFVRLVMKSGERRKLVDSFKKLTVKERAAEGLKHSRNSGVRALLS